MKPFSLMIFIIMIACCFAGAVEPIPTNGERPLTVPYIREPAGYSWQYSIGRVAIAGETYTGYGWLAGNNLVSFDVQGWDAFSACIGVIDTSREVAKGDVIFEIDGNTVKKISVALGQPAVKLSLSLTNVRKLTITMPTAFSPEDGICLAEPKLIKGKVGDAIAPQAPPGTLPGIPCVICGAAFPTQLLLDQHCDEKHRIVVDPRDIKSLAAALRKRVDAKPGVMNLVAKGHVALATFNRIAVYSPATASDIAENLSTELINLDFPLVERGQLDKVLKELKIQDTGMIDPKTAKQIGQLAGCDLIIVGSISDQGQFVVINCRLLETATGKALAAEQVEMRKSIITR